VSRSGLHFAFITDLCTQNNFKIQFIFHSASNLNLKGMGNAKAA
jgi:hypothetical protein